MANAALLDRHLGCRRVMTRLFAFSGVVTVPGRTADTLI